MIKESFWENIQLKLNHRRRGESVQNKIVGERGIVDGETVSTRALGVRLTLGNEGRPAVWVPLRTQRNWFSHNTSWARCEEAQCQSKKEV